ncbi:octopamine receptor 1-like [Lineus longissimus]|uniref:octopamine receptor 1-like n=1 Tax=Lineus longissimus TaxID=88925 RepID=UPI00315DE74B
MADFFRGLTVMTYVLATSIKHGAIQLDGASCNFGGFTNTLFLSASLLTLAAVSIDRYIAIIQPLKYHQLMTVARATGLLTGVWVIAFLNALGPLLGWSSYVFIPSRSICTFSWLGSLSYSITSVTVSFVVPFLILTFCYVNICHVAWQQQRKIAAINNQMLVSKQVVGATSGESTPPVTRQAKFAHILSIKKEKKAALTLFLVFGIFIVCITPSYIITIWDAYNPAQAHDDGMVLALALSGLISYANSAANPFLYCILNKAFKQTFVNLICCRYQRTYSMSNLSQEQAERAIHRQFKLRFKETDSSMSSNSHASEDAADGRRSTPPFSTDQAYTRTPTRPPRPHSGSMIVTKQRRPGMTVSVPLQRALLINRMFLAENVLQ